MNDLDMNDLEKYLNMSEKDLNTLLNQLKNTDPVLENSNNLLDDVTNLNMSESDLDNLLMGIKLTDDLETEFIINERKKNKCYKSKYRKK